MSVVARLQAFFEERLDPRPIALARMVVALAALVRSVESYGYIRYVLQPETARAPVIDGLPLLSLHGLPYYWAAWALAAIAFFIGFRTRTAGAVLTAALGYHLIADQNLFFNHIHFMVLIVFLLTVAGAGATWSVDWFLVGFPRRTVPRWAVTLGAAQVSIVYFYTALAKISPYFLSGDVLTKVLRGLPDAIKTPELMTAAAYGVVAGEMFLAFGLWFPRTRVAALLLGVAMHASIPFAIHPYVVLLVFSATAIGAYGFFLRGEDVDWVWRAVSSRVSSTTDARKA